MIPDRFFYPLVALVVAGLIGLAMFFPKGEGYDVFGPEAAVASSAPAAAQPATPAKPAKP